MCLSSPATSCPRRQPRRTLACASMQPRRRAALWAAWQQRMSPLARHAALPSVLTELDWRSLLAVLQLAAGPELPRLTAVCCRARVCNHVCDASGPTSYADRLAVMQSGPILECLWQIIKLGLLEVCRPTLAYSCCNGLSNIQA